MGCGSQPMESRTKQYKLIGRLNNVMPSEGEWYYFRVLLLHRKGPTSFRDLETLHSISGMPSKGEWYYFRVLLLHRKQPTSFRDLKTLHYQVCYIQGKTFLFCALLASIRRDGSTLATASAGTPSIMMPGGRTAHSRFKIPIPLLPTSTCTIAKRSNLASLLHEEHAIISDESSTAHRNVIEVDTRRVIDFSFWFVFLSFYCFHHILFWGAMHSNVPVLST